MPVSDRPAPLGSPPGTPSESSTFLPLPPSRTNLPYAQLGGSSSLNGTSPFLPACLLLNTPCGPELRLLSLSAENSSVNVSHSPRTRPALTPCPAGPLSCPMFDSPGNLDPGSSLGSSNYERYQERSGHILCPNPLFGDRTPSASTQSNSSPLPGQSLTLISQGLSTNFSAPAHLEIGISRHQSSSGESHLETESLRQQLEESAEACQAAERHAEEMEEQLLEWGKASQLLEIKMRLLESSRVKLCHENEALQQALQESCADRLELELELHRLSHLKAAAITATWRNYSDVPSVSSPASPASKVEANNNNQQPSQSQDSTPQEGRSAREEKLEKENMELAALLVAKMVEVATLKEQQDEAHHDKYNLTVANKQLTESVKQLTAAQTQALTSLLGSKSLIATSPIAESPVTGWSGLFRNARG
eukprot:CAMPEP_0119104858 /NCGR_PEP_ID=MMETSP1180-20130426/2958_1 /TAXON_ID=3052 ORGANISM="Chlamydomonas cf sp, Strain CCMP681" /NCGR_SAMPLE_ID=MMETSP1180 /ASSEMBLY_ACC=CAM_ASM_000741 /LENGTH=420 /DNA_ID=CAMNT_0007089717 /DNA_START=120 /DNA_END=1382 /DNA_ORIENTATION=-